LVIISVSGNAAAATGTNSSRASGFASLQIVTASCHGASGSITCSKFRYQLYRYRNQRAFRHEVMRMFQNELQGTTDKLEKTDENLFAIVNKTYIIAAQNEWNLAVQFATTVRHVCSLEARTLAVAA
jgi:hypothetical protein